MKRWVAAATVVLAGALVMPAPAAEAAPADLSDCADSRYVGVVGWETFEVEPRWLPPSMRSGWDCAVRVEGREFDETLLPDGSYATAINFILIYVDMDYDGMLEFFRAFERSGYMADDDINIIADPAGGSQSGSFGIDDLVDRDPRPGYVHARFSHPADVPPPASPFSNIYALTWTDGVDYQSDSGIEGRPQLMANLIVTEPFGSATGIADPSRLSGLRTILEAAPTPAQWGVIGAGSVMLMLVVGWPSSLLNTVIGSRYQALTSWLRARLPRRKRPTDDEAATPVADGRGDTPRTSRLPGWLMWPGFALAAVIGAFVDPDFGANPMSARVVVTLFASFVLFNLAAWMIVRRVARRLQPDARPYLRFRWGSLVIVALAVLVARLLELEPGVIFGLVAGIAYAVTLQASRSAPIVLVGSAFALALAIVGWVGYSFLAPVAVGTPDNVVLVFLVEFLSGVTIKGVSSLPLALLPLGNLDGAKVIRWKKWVWGVAYAIGLSGFMVVLLTIPKAWGEIPGDFVRWIAIFGGYALLAIVIWALNAWRLAKKPPRPESEQGDQPDAITLD